MGEQRLRTIDSLTNINFQWKIYDSILLNMKLAKYSKLLWNKLLYYKSMIFCLKTIVRGTVSTQGMVSTVGVAYSALCLHSS